MLMQPRRFRQRYWLVINLPPLYYFGSLKGVGLDVVPGHGFRSVSFPHARTDAYRHGHVRWKERYYQPTGYECLLCHSTERQGALDWQPGGGGLRSHGGYVEKYCDD